MPTRDVFTSIRIDAPPARVWETLADFARWPDWNPVVKAIRTELEPGAIVRFKIKLAGPAIPIQARLLVADADRELRWRGPPQAALGAIVAGEHFMRLRAVGDDQTEFEHGEIFTGLLVPLIWWRLAPILDTAYDGMNRALKRRVEQG